MRTLSLRAKSDLVTLKMLNICSIYTYKLTFDIPNTLYAGTLIQFFFSSMVQYYEILTVSDHYYTRLNCIRILPLNFNDFAQWDLLGAHDLHR